MQWFLSLFCLCTPIHTETDRGALWGILSFRTRLVLFSVATVPLTALCSAEHHQTWAEAKTRISSSASRACVRVFHSDLFIGKVIDTGGNAAGSDWTNIINHSGVNGRMRGTNELIRVITNRANSMNLKEKGWEEEMRARREKWQEKDEDRRRKKKRKRRMKMKDRKNMVLHGDINSRVIGTKELRMITNRANCMNLKWLGRKRRRRRRRRRKRKRRRRNTATSMVEW